MCTPVRLQGEDLSGQRSLPVSAAVNEWLILPPIKINEHERRGKHKSGCDLLEEVLVTTEYHGVQK